jgi:hypothetical protein
MLDKSHQQTLPRGLTLPDRRFNGARYNALRDHRPGIEQGSVHVGESKSVATDDVMSRQVVRPVHDDRGIMAPASRGRDFDRIRLEADKPVLSESVAM